MRLVEASPDFRVVRARTQRRPYTATSTSIRQRWRDMAMARRMASSSANTTTTSGRSMASSSVPPRRVGESRSPHVESVPDTVFFDHAELLFVIEEDEKEQDREEAEEREPASAESAPLRYSQQQHAAANSTPTSSLTALPLNNGCHSVPATGSQLPDYTAMTNTSKLVEVAGAHTGDSRICLADILANTVDPSRPQHHLLQGQAAPQSQVARWEPPPVPATLPSSGAVTVVDKQFRTMSIVSVASRNPGQQQQQRQENKSAAASRRRVLMKILGMRKFYKALALVREGKSIIRDRRRMMQIPQPQQVPAASLPPQQNQSNVCNGETPSEGWPPVARDLVLSLTRLVTALEETQVPELPKLPWEELLPQVRQDIMAYKEWMSLTESRE